MSAATQTLEFWSWTNPSTLITFPAVTGPGNAARALITATGDSPTAGAYFVNNMGITEDINQADGGFVVGVSLQQSFGGPNAHGGRELIEVTLTQTAPTAFDNPNRNYVAAQFNSVTSTGDGGTPAAPKGAYFGVGGFGHLAPGAIGCLNVTGAEFDVAVEASASAWAKFGAQVAGHMLDRVQGTVYDAGYAVGRQTGSTVGFRYGFLIANYAGLPPIDPNVGVLFGTQDAGVAATGFDVSSYVLATIIKAKNFSLISGPPMTLYVSGLHGRAYFGASGQGANFPGLFFRSSGLCDYDCYLIAEGGTAKPGQGFLQLAGAFVVGGPAGGSMGPGTLNAEKGVYVNGQELQAQISALQAAVAALRAKGGA